MKVDKANQISFTTKHALGKFLYFLFNFSSTSNVYFLSGTHDVNEKLIAGSNYTGKQNDKGVYELRK